MAKYNDHTVIGQIAELKNKTRADLLKHWQSAYRKPAPKGISRRILEMAAAYNIQEKAYVGLPPNIKLKLKRYRPDTALKSKDANIPDGTILVREWNGILHRVEAIDGKFIWAEKTYNSLSEIARKITGTRWSGPRFFGLGKINA